MRYRYGVLETRAGTSEAELSFVHAASGTGVLLRLGSAEVAHCPAPVSVQCFDDGRREWIRGGYARFVHRRARPEVITAYGSVAVSGCIVAFRDRYRARSGGIVLARRVTVESGASENGFLSAMEWEIDGATYDDAWFAPGIWFGRNEHVPDYAIGAARGRAQRSHVAFREDRLTLPFMLHFDENRNLAFAVTRIGAGGDTIAADDDDAPVIDERLRFGAFSLSAPGSVMGYWFPGTEGDATYPPMWTSERGNRQSRSPVNPFARKRATNAGGWVQRYHPLRAGVRQLIVLRFDATRIDSFARACDVQWRKAAWAYRPRVKRCNLKRVERLSVDLLAATVRRVDGAVGIPTWLDVFTGRPGERQNTIGIGFVARNLEAARLLLEYGHRARDNRLLSLGTDILDFWTTRSGYGLCHTEFDPAESRWVDADVNGEPAVYLRDQSDAHRSTLQAWREERERGREHPAWLSWAASYGDWLTSEQNAEGWYARTYRLDSRPVEPVPGDSSHAVPFLLDMETVMGTGVYARLAERIAEFVYRRFHASRTFVGATLDNPNCLDKESAALAMEAYLRLYESTSDARWLTRAEDAGRWCEQWTFLWNVPMPRDDPNRFFPAGKSTVGYQLITSGFSAFDIYLTRHVGDFVRLSRYTGDPWFLTMARLFLYNTKSTVQAHGELAYARDGFQIEHWSTGRGRGFGLNSGWLPWVSTSHIISIREARYLSLA